MLVSVVRERATNHQLPMAVELLPTWYLITGRCRVPSPAPLGPVVTGLMCDADGRLPAQRKP